MARIIDERSDDDRGSNASNYRSKPLYFFDMDEVDDEEILKWISAQRKGEKQDRSATYRRFEVNLAAVLGRGVSMTSQNRFSPNSHQLTRSGPPKKYVRLKVNRIKQIVETLLSKYMSNKTNFFVTPRNTDDWSQERKAKTGKRILDTVLSERKFEAVKRVFVNDALIFGESYILVKWNKDIGPTTSKKIVSAEFEDERDVSPKEVQLQKRMGDVDFENIDPRYIIVQQAPRYKESEWVLIEDYHFPEKMKLQYPELSDDIVPSDMTDNDMHFCSSSLDNIQLKGMVRRYRIFHRATREMPEGRYIEATDEVILKNESLGSKRIIKDGLFPVVQLTDHNEYGSPRGAANSVLNPARPLQLAIHNLWSILLRNIAKFSPIRVWPAEMDPKILEQGTAQDVILSGHPSITPQLLSQDPVSGSMMSAIQQLDTKLLQLSHISPALEGQGGTNMEVRSGAMLEIFKEQDAARTLPMNNKISEALSEIASLVLAIAADNYKKNEKRMSKIFGKKSRFSQQGLELDHLDVPMDVRIVRGSAMPTTVEGKIAMIERLFALFPPEEGQRPLMSREEMIDILELGEPEKFYDSVTSSIDTAEKEIGEIQDGKIPSAPIPQLELYSYYDTYLRAAQHPDFKDEIPDPETFEKMAISGEGSGAGFVLASQLNEIEMIMWEKAQTNPMVQQELQLRFPFFPTIFSPEPEDILDPQELEEEQAIPEELPPLSPEAQ